MGRGEYEYIKGSTATNPSRKGKVQNPNRKYKEAHKVRQNRKLKIRNKRKNDRKYVLSVAVVILCFGSITILGDSKVYSMQEQVRALNSQMSELEQDNEALKIKVLKYSSLKNIQKNAEVELAMIIPQKDDVVKVDCSNNYFVNIESEVENQENKKDEDDIIEKLKKLFV